MAARQQVVRHAIGGFRGFDKKFAHSPDVMAADIVGLGAHQFCCVEIHTLSSPRVSVIVRTPSVSNSSRQQKTRAPNNLGGGQVPHTNGLTFSRQRTLPTRPLAPWLALRAKKLGHLAVGPFSGHTAAWTYQGQVRVRCPYSWGRDLLRYVTVL